jgi:hypothetical protein
MSASLGGARGGALAALAVLALTGCGGTPAGGDPGDRRLKELAAEPVFSVQPQGATVISTTQTKATYQKPGFTGGGWRGPSVVVKFTSSTPPVDVYRFYGTHAAASGWTPTSAGSLGVTDAWTKTYPDGAAATLLLSRLGTPPAGTKATYLLSGGVAPKVH